MGVLGFHSLKKYPITMKAVVAFLLLAMVYATSAIKPMLKADCTVDAASKCVTEVGAAFDACQDWSGPEEILNCMEQIIGATDCWDCVCTVLSFLPWCQA